MDQNKLFCENLKLVTYIFQKYFNKYNNHQEDMIQEGYGALWKCCLSFDENRGYKFSTYACPAIYRAMNKYKLKHILRHSAVLSLDAPLDCESNKCNCALGDMIGQDDNFTPKYIIEEAISEINENEQKFVIKIMRGMRQEDIAKEYHVSQTTISRTLAKFKKIYMKILRN